MDSVDSTIARLESLLLPRSCHFAADAREVINCWGSTNVLACPGSGKTTVLMAKLKILADQMPWADGRGICILSHTNVAIDEIKNRLAADSGKILGYPNFAGTIQSFVDTFVVFPFWRSFAKIPLRVVSLDEYARRSWQRMQCGHKYSALRGLILHNSGDNTANESPIKAIEKLSLDTDGVLLLSGKKKGGADSKSAQQFKELNQYLHKSEGLITYEDAYKCTSDILKRHGEQFRPVLSARFKYVFVDEYQDCSDLQRSVLNDLFDGTDTVVQRIGDMDQAIYSNIYESNESTWDVADGFLEISETNRYGNEIALVLSKLRSTGKDIVSARGVQKRKPVLFVYSPGTEKKVIDFFVREIRQAELAKDGVYKAVGMVRKSAGMKISQYWSCFDANVASVAKDGWDFYRQEIIKQLTCGRLYKVEQTMVDFLLLVSRCCDLRTEQKRLYSRTGIRRKIEKSVDKRSLEGILELAVSFAKDPKGLEQHLLTFLCELGTSIFECNLTEAELADRLSEHDERESQPVALDRCYSDGISVQLDTVHGVKGETHDATLYLETEHSKSSDLRRIMPLFEGKAFKNQGIYEKSRRCAYVGMSRPRHLLCVAMQEKTYTGHEPAFEADWKVIHIN